MNPRRWLSTLGLWTCLFASASAVPAQAADCAQASSTAFTQAQYDAPFFVFDGGSQGAGIGQFDRPLAIADLGSGLLGIVDSGNDRVKIVTTAGFFQDFLGGSGGEPGRLRSPSGLEANDEGAVWVVDRGNHRLQLLSLFRDVTELPGSFLRQIALPPTAGKGPPGSLNHMTRDAEGRLYVVDATNRRIARYAAAGGAPESWGPTFTRGAGPEAAGEIELMEPYGIAAGPAGRIFLTDVGAARVLRLSSTGELEASWGEPGSDLGQLLAPRGLAVGPDGFVYVADSGNHRVQKFDLEGNFVASVGCEGDGVGRFREPSDVVIDEERHLYVVDTGNHRIQKLGHQ